SYIALFTGPYKIIKNISKYEDILLIISKFRIATVIPYLKNIIYNYNTCTL
ncbi:hypothetical protein BO94DRAFT_453306, partial [Aspergillus sclerotioniger CBS 115572]